MKTSDKLLLSNKSWVQEQKAVDPTFFQRLARVQRPEVLWIGCSDSRVPANQITATEPGEIFVHRNIANLFTPGDINATAVLRYAVAVLQVKHVIVCGHYGCGGIRAAIAGTELGEVSQWLKRVGKVYDAERENLAGLSEEARENRVCELSVLEQVRALADTAVIKDAWAGSDGGPCLHGWVYGLTDGMLRQLIELAPGGASVPPGRS